MVRLAVSVTAQSWGFSVARGHGPEDLCPPPPWDHGHRSPSHFLFFSEHCRWTCQEGKMWASSSSQEQPPLGRSLLFLVFEDWGFFSPPGPCSSGGWSLAGIIPEGTQTWAESRTHRLPRQPDPATVHAIDSVFLLEQRGEFHQHPCRHGGPSLGSESLEIPQWRLNFMFTSSTGSGLGHV